MATKQLFLSILQRELAKYDWTKDEVRWNRAMEAARSTLNGSRTCAIDGVSWKTAWKEIGMKGKPTYKGLHALPESEAA